MIIVQQRISNNLVNTYHVCVHYAPVGAIIASPIVQVDYKYTGQMKVALVDVETHDNPIPLESYTRRQGKVWAVICYPGKPFIITILKRCDN